VLLIAGNFLREQRWLIILLLGWVFASSFLLGLDQRPAMDDSLFILRQQAVYGLAFAGFLAAAAIHNERRTRRILTVLSKGIERRHYLAGLLCGIAAIEIVYTIAMAIGGEWVLRRSEESRAGLWWMLLVLFVTAILIAAIALFFSTFLNPLLAMAASALTVAIPPALAPAMGARFPLVLPVYDLVAYIMASSLRAAASPDPALLAIAAVEAALFWLGAAWVFGRRDIAAAVE
jgi:hypothetical protein